MLFAPFVAENVCSTHSKTVSRNRLWHRRRSAVHLNANGELRIGGYVLDQPIVTMSKATKGLQATSEYDGILGAEILKHFKLYLDYGHGRVILEPNRVFQQPFEFDTSGLVVIAQGPTLRQFQVHRVIEGSPAAKAGLQVGDEIVSLDGRPAAEFTLEALRSELVAPGKSREIEVRRGEQKSRTRISLRRLV